jgi:tRNA(Ile)-lysidine synthase
VTDLGARFDVPATIVAVEVPRSGSLEDAARRVRHAALERVASEIGASRIALGHTADDQAETVLMRLLQGAGPRGLAAIPPVRGRIVRPLIETRRAVIIETLQHLGQGWRDDPSNDDRHFLRNRLRHDVLPLVAATAPDVVEALCRTARLGRETIDALESAASETLTRIGTRAADEVTLPLADLKALPADVAADVLRQAAGAIGRRTPLRAWAHRGLARLLADPPPRRSFRLGGVRVDVGSGRVRLGGTPVPPFPARALAVPGVTPLPEIARALVARYLDATGYDVPRSASAAAFDADRLAMPLTVRARRRGDRFVTFGGPERRLKHVLIAAKIPRWRRDALPIVENVDGIAWVAGVRRGAVAPVVSSTRHVLEIALVPLAEAGPGR